MNKAGKTNREQERSLPYPGSAAMETLLLKVVQSLNLKKKTLQEHFSSIIDIIENNWHFLVPLHIKIVYKTSEAKSGNYPELVHTIHTIRTIHEDLCIRNKKSGYIEVGYHQDSSTTNPAFLEDRAAILLKTASLVLERIIEQDEAAAIICKLAAKLKERNVILEDKHRAFKEIVRLIEKEKAEIKAKIQLNIKQFIVPVINKLKAAALPEETRMQYIAILESNLSEIAAGFKDKIIKDEVKLSPRELEICNMISNGYHSKEIAQILQISVLTVERHRFNIRKKVGIRKHQVNLQSFLQKH